MDLTWDQNVSRKDERERIDVLGGIELGRVKGRITVTRGFGDADCKMGALDDTAK
jgi:hypothetical protein